jgi:hypothetical protein
LDGIVSLSTPPPPPSAETQPVTAARRGWVSDLAVGACIIVLLELVAVPVGLLWGHIAPHPLYSVGGHTLNLAEDSAKPLVRADFWFLVVTGVAGIISGCAAFAVAKRGEIGATLGLAIGGLAAGWLAWRVGHAWTGGTQPLSLALQAGSAKVHLAPDLGARVVLISWAVAAVAIHGILYAVTWPAKTRSEQVPAFESAERPWTTTQAPSGPPVPEG